MRYELKKISFAKNVASFPRKSPTLLKHEKLEKQGHRVSFIDISIWCWGWVSEKRSVGFKVLKRMILKQY